MGKTFVEDERPCDSCVNVTRYGCVSWNCEYINRDEAIKAWREKHETADRKTENSSEKPNNSTISKMEQVDKDINVRSKDEPTGYNLTPVEDEPQTDCAWK